MPGYGSGGYGKGYGYGGLTDAIRGYRDDRGTGGAELDELAQAINELRLMRGS